MSSYHKKYQKKNAMLNNLQLSRSLQNYSNTKRFLCMYFTYQFRIVRCYCDWFICYSQLSTLLFSW